MWIVAAIVAVAAVIVAAVIVSQRSADPRVGRIAPTPTPVASTPPPTLVTGTPVPSLSPSPSPLPPGTFENKILGYRITLPEGYRRGSTNIVTGNALSLGGDTYNRATEQQERERCLTDSGDIGVLAFSRGDIHVSVSPNPRGISPQEWVTTPRVPGAQPLSTHQKIERITINGLEAVRLVEDNARASTTAFVISGNDRMYELSPQIRPLDGASLDDIAKTFAVIQPAPFPSPTATVAPRVAARELAETLMRALAARDTEALARVLPSCWINVTTVLDGQSTGGVKLRSVALFSQGLRERFAAGDLTVIVDPTLQEERGELFVRSEWKEPDRSTRIDLFLMERQGRWQVLIARHYYRSADLNEGRCIPYRQPWASGTC